MRTSNKVLLAAVAALMALFLAFVLVMGFTVRSLLRQTGRTVLAVPAAPLEWQSPPSAELRG